MLLCSIFKLTQSHHKSQKNFLFLYILVISHLFRIESFVNYPCHLLSSSFGLVPFPETGEGKKKNIKVL